MSGGTTPPYRVVYSESVRRNLVRDYHANRPSYQRR